MEQLQSSQTAKNAMFKQLRAHFVPGYLWCGAALLLAALSAAPLVLLTYDFFSVSPPRGQGDLLFFRSLSILFIWALCESGMSFLTSTIRYEIHSILQRQVLQTLERLPDVVSFAEKRRRIVRDMATIEQWFSEKLIRYFSACITLSVSLVIWFLLAPGGAIRALSIFAFWTACFGWLGRRRIFALRASKVMPFRQTRLFQEVLSGARAAQSLLSIPFILRRHETLHRAQRRPFLTRSARFLSGAFLFQILSLGTGLLLWAWMIESLDAVTLDRQFHVTLWCLLMLSAGWRIRAVVDETAQVRRAVRSIFRNTLSAAAPAGARVPAGLPDKMIWGVEFDRCLVRASGRTAAIAKPVEIDRGSITVLLGPAGSGKSLVLEALCGLRKAEWTRLRIQDALGNFTQTEASSEGEELCIPKALFSYVESSPFLFQGSVAENLTLGNTQRLSDMTLWQHLELVGLLPVVKALGGLQAPLPRALGRLSDSERFRLALVRALLLDRPFLALDDPFKVLDEQSWRRLVPLFHLQKEFCGIVIACRQLPPRLTVDKVVSFTTTNPAWSHASHPPSTDPILSPFSFHL